MGCASRFFSSLAGLGQHQKWEGVASFFGIVTLGSRKPILAQDWYGCWRRCWIPAIGALAKLHQNCLTFVTTHLGMLLLSLRFGGSCFAKDHQTVFGGIVVQCFCFACFELQRMLFPECCSGFVLTVSPTMLETFFVVCPLLLERMESLDLLHRKWTSLFQLAGGAKWHQAPPPPPPPRRPPPLK